MTAKGRRGGTMVEAAVVFPLVILTVITCVMICIMFHNQTVQQSRQHIALRHSAEAASGHTEYREKDEHDIETSKRGLFYTSHGKGWVSMKKNLLLKKRTDQKIEGVWTSVDGVSYVRYCTLAGNIAEDVGDYK